MLDKIVKKWDRERFIYEGFHTIIFPVTFPF